MPLDLLKHDFATTLGCKVALIADTPKVMTDGNWRVGVFIDDRTTDAQFDQLVRSSVDNWAGPWRHWLP